MTSRYQFFINFNHGLRIECKDNECPDTTFQIKIFVNKIHQNSKLKWNYLATGGNYVVEEITNSKEFKIEYTKNYCPTHTYFAYHYRGLIPYIIEIYNNQELIHTEKFDPRHKLINFTLNSDDPKTIHTWMCAIENFKKENNCQISIINNYLKVNQNYDFVDSYWDVEEEFDRYYAGYLVGRYGSDDAPDLYLNPNGTKNKNDLEIIEDILYYYIKNL